MTRRTSQSMRRSVGDLRVCRVRSDLAEALPLRARRQQQAPKLGRPRLRRSVQRRTRPATRQQAHVRQRLRDARGYRSAQSFGRSLWAFRTSTTSRSSRRFAPRSRRERPLNGPGPYLKVRGARRAVDGPSNTRPIGALPASTLQRVLVAVLLQTFVSPNSRIIRHTDTRAVAEPI